MSAPGGTVDLATAATRLARGLTTLQRAAWREKKGLVDAPEAVTADGRCVELTEESVAMLVEKFDLDHQRGRLRKSMTRRGRENKHLGLIDAGLPVAALGLNKK